MQSHFWGDIWADLQVSVEKPFPELLSPRFQSLSGAKKQGRQYSSGLYTGVYVHLHTYTHRHTHIHFDMG